MKAVYAFLFISSMTVLVNAGYIGHTAHTTTYSDSTRAGGPIPFVIAILELVGSQFGLNTSQRRHLSNDETAAIVASLYGNGRGLHGHQNRLSNADTAAIVASLYANGDGHHSHSSGLSDIVPAVVTGTHANGYGHQTHQVATSQNVNTHKVATSSHAAATIGGYNYGHKSK